MRKAPGSAEQRHGRTLDCASDTDKAQIQGPLSRACLLSTSFWTPTHHPRSLCERERAGSALSSLAWPRKWFSGSGNPDLVDDVLLVKKEKFEDLDCGRGQKGLRRTLEERR